MEIPREKDLNKLIERKHDGLVKVVTGLRRSGKSYLLFHLFKAHLLSTGVKENYIIEIAFDSLQMDSLCDP